MSFQRMHDESVSGWSSTNETANLEAVSPSPGVDAGGPPVDGDLIYGEVYDYLVFIPRAKAVESAQLHHALRTARTWGDLRAMVTPARYREIVTRVADEDAYCGDEDDEYRPRAEDEDEPSDVAEPDAADAFAPTSVPGYADGDWPTWYPKAALKWMPWSIQEAYGTFVETIFNGPNLTFDPSREAEVVAALEQLGYVCTRDDALCGQANGFD